MENLPIQTFILLVQLDQKINNLQKNIDDLHKADVEDKQHILLYMQSEEKIKQHKHDVKKDVDGYELEMKELDQKERARRAALDQTQTQREYQSLQQEIERLQKTQHDLEATLIQAWNTYENVSRDYEEKHADLQKNIALATARIDNRYEQIQKLQSEVDALELERPAYTQAIPEEWLEKYGAMRARVTNPVVMIQDDACGACFVNLRQQDLIDLRRRKLIQCKNCFRFLYIPSDVPERSQDETA